MQYDQVSNFQSLLAESRLFADRAGEKINDGDTAQARQMIHEARQRLLLLDFCLCHDLPDIPAMDDPLRESLRQHDQHGEQMQAAGTRGTW